MHRIICANNVARVPWPAPLLSTSLSLSLHHSLPLFLSLSFSNEEKKEAVFMLTDGWSQGSEEHHAQMISDTFGLPTKRYSRFYLEFPRQRKSYLCLLYDFLWLARTDFCCIIFSSFIEEKLKELFLLSLGPALTIEL